MNIVQKLQQKYTNGILITQEEWRKVNSLVEKVKQIERKELYLKDNIILDKFLDIDLESFELMCDENSKMLTLLINLYDYLDFKAEGNTEVFESPEEARDTLQKCLDGICNSRAQLEEYLLSNFE